LLATAAAVVLFLYNPAQSRFYPLCLFHQTTGLQCPGCGSLRALHQLLHGHIVAAFGYNALLIVSLPFLLTHGLQQLLAKSSQRPVQPVKAKWLWAGLALLIAFGVLRNLPFSAFAWMALR
jgi:hypothetical protein